MQDRLLPIQAVLDLVGISRRTLYAEVARGNFPRQVHITRRRVGWRESDLRRWLDARR